MGVGTILSLLGMAVKGLSSAGKSQQQRKYTEETDKARKENEAKQKRESRRNALQRFLKSDLSFYSKPNKTVDVPDTSFMDTLGGVGSSIGALGSSDFVNKMGSGEMTNQDWGDKGWLEQARQKRLYRRINSPNTFDTNINTNQPSDIYGA